MYSGYVSVLRHPWVRSRNLRTPDRIPVMAKRNYKFHADLALSNQLMVHQVSFLEIRAALKLIHNIMIRPALWGSISAGPSLYIADANNYPQRTT